MAVGQLEDKERVGKDSSIGGESTYCKWVHNDPQCFLIEDDTLCYSMVMIRSLSPNHGWPTSSWGLTRSCRMKFSRSGSQPSLQPNKSLADLYVVHFPSPWLHYLLLQSVVTTMLNLDPTPNYSLFDAVRLIASGSEQTRAKLFFVRRCKANRFGLGRTL